VDKNLVEEMYTEFVRLEDMFLDLTQYIPLVANLDDPRYSIASPKAAEFGLECCMWIETLMGELLNDPRWDNWIPGIQDVRKKGVLNIDVFRETMDKTTGLSRGGYALRDLGGPETGPLRNGRTRRAPTRSGSESTPSTSTNGSSSPRGSRWGTH